MRNLKQKVLDALPTYSWISPNEIARQIGTCRTADVREILDELEYENIVIREKHLLTQREIREKCLPLYGGNFRWLYCKI